MTPTSIVLLAACPLACGLATGRPAAAPSVAAPACARAPARTTRRGFGTVLGAAALSPLLSACSAETGASSLNYKVLQQGKGQVPVVGELVVLRWQASFNGKVFDDLYQKNDYYYHRARPARVPPRAARAARCSPGARWRRGAPVAPQALAAATSFRAWRRPSSSCTSATSGSSS